MKRLAPIAVSLAFAAGLALALAACGSGDAVSVGPVPSGTAPGPSDGSSATTIQSSNDGSDTGSSTTTGSEPTDSSPGTTSPDVSYKVWFVRSEALATVPRTHAATLGVGSVALQDLLAGPTASERSGGIGSAVPEGTRLLGLTVANGIATVDLSSEFESGGGSLSMFARLGQVACTLDQFPTVSGIRFALDGEPVDVFSGEGIVLDDPVRCGDYDELLPAIVVEKPAPGARITSGTTVTGTANVFEANVSYFVIANEHVYAKGFTTATCGTGCRGRFSFRLRFDVSKPVEATLVVNDDDAAGTGTPPHVVRIPVTLMPS